MTRLLAGCAALVLTLLTGCASTRIIDSQVLAIANMPTNLSLTGLSYRFERLPSQAANPDAGLAEQQAEQALSTVGLVRNDAAAQWSVQVGFLGTEYLSDPWGRPYGWGPHGALAIGRGTAWGGGVGVGMNMRMPPSPQHRREVSLILRDLRSGQIVYETRAVHDGPWSDSKTIFATLFQAALAHFPNPPTGPFKVDIQVPR